MDKGKQGAGNYLSIGEFVSATSAVVLIYVQTAALADYLRYIY